MIDEKGYYVIEEYDKKPPFASFLAGIAGTGGKPLWSFFVNRAQGMSSFGMRDKNGCMMAFYPANEAYKMVYSNGFRTFIKWGEHQVYEPFAVSNEEGIARTMKIKNNELKLEEINNSLGLKCTVTYYSLPNESFGALARRVEVEHLGEGQLEIEVLDGMPALLPYGTQLKEYKEIANTLRSWMQAEVTGEDMAIYRLRASSEDTAEVKVIESLYYYKAFDDHQKSLSPIIDPQSIFGYDTSYALPLNFLNHRAREAASSIKECFNKVPAAFCLVKRSLAPDQKMAIYSYIGYANGMNEIEKISSKIGEKGYFERKLGLANALIEEVTRDVETKTAYPLWDAYIKQSYLDNVLRGGYPISLGKKSKQIYYIYSRKHGDLERDYNFFSIEPNYYSQGNANFRDVCQNRRLETYMHPEVKDENVKLFYDLMQLDGYNPLIISGKKFRICNPESLEAISEKYHLQGEVKLAKLLEQEFTIGELYGYLKEELNKTSHEIQEIMNETLDRCEGRIKAEFGEGFWIDHWTYTLDLAEQFLEIYPDKRQSFLIEERKYRYFNSSHYVLPRGEKYVLSKGKVRQYVAVKPKEEALTSDWLQTTAGETYTTNLMTKLLTLALIKFTTLDPYGMGIEMEAGKPGWNDAMNGMPGILGSSTGEMFELKRLLQFIKQNLDLIVGEIEVPIEFRDLIQGIEAALSLFYYREISDIEYWDTLASLRERFREKTKYIISDKAYSIAPVHMKQLVESMLQKIEKGIYKLKALKTGILPTFLYYEVDHYETKEDSSGKQVIAPTHFDLHVLPEFLEGPVRYFKVQLSEEEKTALYKQIKASDIYDKKLKMYKVSASLENVSYEIGRSRIFTPGWLERESIFMHMSFKYLLELIKNHLYEAFFEDMKEAIPAFMNPEIYGRSVLENASFIASSANPDGALHGKGFIARLSGTTIEFLTMWKIMMVGPRLFDYEKDVLSFKLEPILTKDFFDEKNEVKTTILGSIQVTYSNPNKKDTFGREAGQISNMILHYKKGNKVEIEGNTVWGETAEAIRNKEVLRITATIV